MEVLAQQSNLGCKLLADHLQSHRDVFLSDWLKEAGSDPSVPTDALTRLEVLDHVPQMFDAMIYALRRHCSEAAMEKVQDIASRHTIIRWVQKYDLRAVLREVSFLRKEFIRHLGQFDQEHASLAGEARLFNAITVHGILDDIVMEATSTYLTLKAREEA